MARVQLDPALLDCLASKTAIVTGGAGDIGAEIVRTFVSRGANVVIADLEHARSSAEALIKSLPEPSHAIFSPTNILDWSQMKATFKSAVSKFGGIDIVIANAGVMESQPMLDLGRLDENGELLEATEGFKVIDINIKGTINTLRLAMHHMKSNPPRFPDGSRGSIVMVISTSGYFGGTGVAAYVSSKHGVTGLLRASQIEATKNGIRVNGVAPFFTPTAFTSGFAKAWAEKGLEANTPEGVAKVIAHMAVDHTRRGSCFLTCGNIIREMEVTINALLGTWLGDDAAKLMSDAMKLFVELGGFPLPALAAMGS